MLLGDEGQLVVGGDQLVEGLAALHHAGMGPVGQGDDGALAAHQVVKEVTGDQLAHLVVVAGGVDLHAVDIAAVHAEDGDARVHGLPELVLQLGGVGADQHDGVGAGGGDVLDAAGQLREVVGGVDDVDLGALGGQVGLQVAHHLVRGDGGHVGGHNGDGLPGEGAFFRRGGLFRRSRRLG